MCRRRLFLPLLAVLAVFIALSLCGQISQRLGAQDIAGSYSLPAGSVYDGDLSIVARNVVLMPSSGVTGSVSIFATDSLRISGTIGGDLSIFAPSVDVQLDSSLVVGGKFSACARHINALDAIRVGGTRSTGCDQLRMLLDGLNQGQTATLLPNMPQLNIPILGGYGGDLFASLPHAVGNAISLAVLAALGTLVFPARFRRMTNAAVLSRMQAGVVGFLSMGTASALTLAYLVLTALTLGLLYCAFPIITVGWWIVTAMLIVGWIAVSFPVGVTVLRRVAPRLNPASARVFTAAVGAFSLTLVQGILISLPCIKVFSGLLIVVAGSIGLGTVILTRFGGQSYPEYVTVKRKI